MKKILFCILFISSQAFGATVNVGNADLDGAPISDLNTNNSSFNPDTGESLTVNNNTIIAENDNALSTSNGIDVTSIGTGGADLTINNIAGIINVEEGISINFADEKKIEINNSGVINVQDIEAINNNYLELTNSGTINASRKILMSNCPVPLCTSNSVAQNSFITLNGGILNTPSIEIYHPDQVVNINNNAYLQGDMVIKYGLAGEASGGIVNIDSVNDTQSLSGVRSIGASDGKLSEINIKGGSALYAHNVKFYADSINLDSSALFISGDESSFSSAIEVTGNQSAITFDVNNLNLDIDASTAQNFQLSLSSHSSTGSSLSLANDATINSNVSVSSSGEVSSGNYVATGAVSFSGSSNTALNLTLSETSLDNLYKTIDQDAKSTALLQGGSDGINSAITDSAIDVNQSGDNKIGLIHFTTQRESARLLNLKITVDTANLLNSSDKQVNDTLKATLNSNADGELLTIKKYLIATDGVTSSQRQSTAKSLQANAVGLNQDIFTNTQSSVNVLQSRLANTRIASISKEKNYKIVDKYGQETRGADDLATARNDYGTFRDGFEEDNDLKKSLWVQTSYNNSKQNDRNGFSGYDSDSFALTIGLDKKINKDTTIGGAITIANSEIEASSNLSTTQIDSYQLSFYGEKTFGKKFYVNTVISAAQNEFSSTRQISLIGKNANADYSGETYSAKIGYGMINKFANNIELSPELSLFYAHNSIDSYQENGAGTANLEVSNDDSQMLEASAGFTLGYNNININDFRIYPKIGLNYGYDVIGNEQISRTNFVGQTTSFTSQSSKVNKSVIRLNAGLSIYSQESFTFFANYILQKRTGFVSHTGLLKAQYNF